MWWVSVGGAGRAGKFSLCVVRNLFPLDQLATLGERHAGTIEDLEARLEALSRSKVRFRLEI